VRRAARNKNRGTGVRLDDVFPHANAECAFEHVPRFVIVAVEMKWSNPARRSRRTACIFPLGDHEIPAH
jgi:hypothetical protein